MRGSGREGGKVGEVWVDVNEIEIPRYLRVWFIGGRSAASAREGTTIISKRHRETLRGSTVLKTGKGRVGLPIILLGATLARTLSQVQTKTPPEIESLSFAALPLEKTLG
jgi:hypothetical protein